MVFSTVFVWSTPGAGACSCAESTDQQAFEQADVVFEGTVAAEQVDLDLAVIDFDVSGVFKGDARQTQSIYTDGQASDCTPTTNIGGTYFVFADVIDGTEDTPGYPIGDLRAGLCGGTRPAGNTALDLDPPVDAVAPIADAPTTTTTLVAPTNATEELAEPFTGGGVFVIGFIVVGIVGAFIASRVAKRSRET